MELSEELEALALRIALEMDAEFIARDEEAAGHESPNYVWGDEWLKEFASRLLDVVRGEPVAWLIESVDARWGAGYFWIGVAEYTEWGTIENAVRFSRREDAERVIASIHANEGKFMRHGNYEACEHMWPNTHPAPSQEARGEPRVDNDIDAGYLPFPSQLHPDTRELVLQFAWRLAIKLRKAEQKYGYSNGWKESGWMDECRAQLRKHVDKGDPLDVAAYCAFLMWHRESTADTHPTPSQEARGEQNAGKKQKNKP